LDFIQVDEKMQFGSRDEADEARVSMGASHDGGGERGVCKPSFSDLDVVHFGSGAADLQAAPTGAVGGVFNGRLLDFEFSDPGLATLAFRPRVFPLG